MRTDSEGNVYVAMHRQGRVLMFSPYAIPIGQILLPGRENNRFLRRTSLGLAPGSRELFIVFRDEFTDGGAVIFNAGGFSDRFAIANAVVMQVFHAAAHAAGHRGAAVHPTGIAYIVSELACMLVSMSLSPVLCL